MVEIIPRRVAPLPFWLKILFYLLVTLLVISLLSFLILSSFQRRSAKTLQNLELEISQERTPQRILLESKILTEQKKIDNFTRLLETHYLASKIFPFLEENSHPQVWFSQLDINPKEGQVIVSGLAKSFSALGQQIYIFQKEALVQDLKLSEVALGKGGEIEFTLDFSFDPKFFK